MRYTITFIGAWIVLSLLEAILVGHVNSVANILWSGFLVVAMELDRRMRKEGL